MFTWHICYTSNSASSQFTVQSMITLKIRRPTPRYYRNKSPRSHGITVNLVPVPAVLPWSWSPSLWCYRELCPHYHGVTAVSAGKPWSPSPCSCLLCMHTLHLWPITDDWAWPTVVVVVAAAAAAGVVLVVSGVWQMPCTRTLVCAAYRWWLSMAYSQCTLHSASVSVPPITLPQFTTRGVCSDEVHGRSSVTTNTCRSCG